MNNYLVTVNGNERKISITYDDAFIMEEKRYELEITQLSNYSFLVKHKEKVYEVTHHKIGEGEYKLTLDGYTFDVNVQTFLKKLTSTMFNNIDERNKEIVIKSPMPGLIIKLFVQEGERVQKGTPLVSLEAMKMENIIKSDFNGIIQKIYIEKSMSVEKDRELIIINKL